MSAQDYELGRLDGMLHILKELTVLFGKQETYAYFPHIDDFLTEKENMIYKLLKQYEHFK